MLAKFSSQTMHCKQNNISQAEIYGFLKRIIFSFGIRDGIWYSIHVEHERDVCNLRAKNCFIVHTTLESFQTQLHIFFSSVLLGSMRSTFESTSLHCTWNRNDCKAFDTNDDAMRNVFYSALFPFPLKIVSLEVENILPVKFPLFHAFHDAAEIVLASVVSRYAFRMQHLVCKIMSNSVSNKANVF